MIKVTCETNKDWKMWRPPFCVMTGQYKMAAREFRFLFLLALAFLVEGRDIWTNGSWLWVFLFIYLPCNHLVKTTKVLKSVLSTTLFSFLFFIFCFLFHFVCICLYIYNKEPPSLWWKCTPNHYMVSWGSTPWQK